MSTQVMMKELPQCDICTAQGRSSAAEYDAKTARGPWAYMCALCWTMFGASRRLGTGIGQRLVLKTEPVERYKPEEHGQHCDEWCECNGGE